MSARSGAPPGRRTGPEGTTPQGRPNVEVTTTDSASVAQRDDSGGYGGPHDGYHAVVSTLGDRFLLLRLDDVDPAKTGPMALAHRGRETQMRAELAEALGGLVEHTDTGKVNRALSDEEVAGLVRLATFTARARTGVARDGYRDVVYLPQVEGPGRVVTALARLLGGLEAIGCDEGAAWSVLARVARDCVPATRVKLARVLLGALGPVKTSDAGARVGMATTTAREHLEDLSLLGLAERTKTSDADNAADLWTATGWLHDHWPVADEKCTYQLSTSIEVESSPNGRTALTGPPLAPLRTSLVSAAGEPYTEAARCSGCRHLLPPNYAAAGLWLCPACEPAEDEVPT